MVKYKARNNARPVVIGSLTGAEVYRDDQLTADAYLQSSQKGSSCRNQATSGA